MKTPTKGPVFLRFLIVSLFVFYMLLPIVATYLFSLATRWDRSIMPEGYTWEAYQTAFNLSYFRITLKNSLILSIASCLVSFIIIVPTVYLTQINFRKFRPLLDLLMIIPFAIPTVVLALSYVRVYTFQPITRSPFLLIMATVVYTMPFMYRSVSNSVDAVDISVLTEASQSLGGDLWNTLTKVIMPNIYPGILSGMLLVFATVFADFTLAKLITGAHFKTFPMLLVEQTQIDGNVAAALSVISFTLAWGISMVLLWFSSKASKSKKAQPSDKAYIGK